MNSIVRTRLEKCPNLPTLPAVALEVLRLCQSEDADLAKIAKVIINDPALSAKILRVLNSPSYGLRQQVRTIPHALALLGINAVRTLALSFSLASQVKSRSQADTNLILYWKRSVLAAVSARELATATGSAAMKDEAFLAALLQDIGRLALLRAVPDLYLPLCVQAGRDHAVLIGLEERELGADHAEIGGWLARAWNLPESIRLAIERSHGPSSTSDEDPARRRLGQLVAVSGWVADIWIGEEAPLRTAFAHERAAEQLKLATKQLDEALVRVASALPEVSSLFEIDLGSIEDIQLIVDQAKEALLLHSLGATRQAADARVTLDQLQERARALEEQSQRDALTGLFNRGRFDRGIALETELAANTGRPLSLMMVDIDHFKHVNDTHGHPAGDKVLAGVAQCLRATLRPRDIVTRYGGEEFAVLLPETDADGAMVVAERVRQLIESTVHGTDPALRVTASLGCATSGGRNALLSPAELLEHADRALYAAKRAGRNRAFASTNPAASDRPPRA